MHFIKENVLFEQIVNQQLNINFEGFNKLEFLELVLDGLAILEQILIELNAKD